MANHNITHKYLLSILDYNPDTGVFVWRERPLKHFKNQRAWNIFNSNFAGKIAGCIHKNGKRKGDVDIKIKNKSYQAHILAWFYFYKKWPKNQIDHNNRNSSDNSIKNLRQANNSQNQSNVGKKTNNKTGYKGVTFHIRDKIYQAHIQKNKKQIYLGKFNTAEEAHAAYCKAAQELHGEFACFG